MNLSDKKLPEIDRDMSRGFLPLVDPLTTLPPAFADWEAVARELPKLALSRYLRPTIAALPPCPVAELSSLAELERAMTMLSYMANLYVFAPDLPPATRLPRSLAMGWYAVARQLDRPPMLTYASQTLYNWRRLEATGPLALGNLTLIQNFLGGMDEEWFVTVHVAIEAAAAPALAQLLPAQTAVSQHDDTTLLTALHTIAETLATLRQLLTRMPERCDPYIYYHRVRPLMFGWKDNPALPQGMIYEGVTEFAGQPRQFRGETGAQSSIIPAIDTALGIGHEYDAMRAYLQEMREYMPAADRAFLTQLEQGASIRAYVQERQTAVPALHHAYNEAVYQLHEFRRQHIEYAALYILKPAPDKQSSGLGTGGTPFTVYLKKHITETADHQLA